jgi:hypothetical protein
MDRGARVAGGRKFITVLGQKVHCDLEENPGAAVRDSSATWLSCDSGLARMRNENTSKRAMCS